MFSTTEQSAKLLGLGEVRPDSDLVTAAAEGDQAAFAELYRRHVDKARRLARKVAGNADNGDDAVADALSTSSGLCGPGGSRRG